jgi:hypothetical protein
MTTQLNGDASRHCSESQAAEMGTLLGGVLKPVAAHHRLTVEELLTKLRL